jgi:flavorubredoxin
MAITNASAGTNVHEIADGVYRINTPVNIVPGGFSFNQYLIVDDQPLLFHTGPRKMFPLVREAVESVIPVTDLRFIALSHFEADECGSLNEWLAVAPSLRTLVQPGCGNGVGERFRGQTSLCNGRRRRARVGERSVKWLDAPHLPHGWETGFLMDTRTKTMFCGDLFTQGARARLP